MPSECQRSEARSPTPSLKVGDSERLRRPTTATISIRAEAHERGRTDPSGHTKGGGFVKFTLAEKFFGNFRPRATPTAMPPLEARNVNVGLTTRTSGSDE